MDLDYSNQDLDILPEIDGNPKYFTCSLNYLRYLPDSIGNFTNLLILECTCNELEYLPDSIGKLSNLEYLACSFNYIKRLPDSICNLTKLRILYCNNNELEYLPNLDLLHTLYCHDNNLIEINGFADCEILECSNNRLKSIPRVQDNCIVYLDGNESTLIIPFGVQYPDFYSVYDRYIKIIRAIITIQRKFRINF